MVFHEFLRSRRSIRRFTTEPVSIDELTRILETANHAPSAHNRQPWRFAVIAERGKKTYLAESLAEAFRRDLTSEGIEQKEIESRTNRSIERITAAPVIVILFLDMSEMDQSNQKSGDKSRMEHTMAIQSAAAAGLQFQLAARAEGLDTVWICSPLFAPEAVISSLQLPITWEPQAMFFLGHTAAAPREKVMKTLDEVVKFL